MILWHAVLVLGTRLRDFLWNGFTEVGCRSMEVESRLVNSAVKWGQDVPTQRIQGWEEVWKLDIFMFPECWRPGFLFPIGSEWQSLSTESVDYASSMNKWWNTPCLGSSVKIGKGIWCRMSIQTSATIWEESCFSSPVLLRLTVCSVRSPEMQKGYPPLPTVKTLEVLENHFEAIVFNF